uniref:Ribosomal protein S3 n=1 Tax=Chromera velia TaxID=505693 RepID=D9IXE9_9ALVE|nr:ribosomal protein S3 [Chromera velia]ADJ66557.1 ribosomal protein S3 [Chromera velia]
MPSTRKKFELFSRNLWSRWFFVSRMKSDIVFFPDHRTKLVSSTQELKGLKGKLAPFRSGSFAHEMFVRKSQKSLVLGTPRNFNNPRFSRTTPLAGKFQAKHRVLLQVSKKTLLQYVFKLQALSKKQGAFKGPIFKRLKPCLMMHNIVKLHNALPLSAKKIAALNLRQVLVPNLLGGKMARAKIGKSLWFIFGPSWWFSEACSKTICLKKGPESNLDKSRYWIHRFHFRLRSCRDYWLVAQSQAVLTLPMKILRKLGSLFFCYYFWERRLHPGFTSNWLIFTQLNFKVCSSKKVLDEKNVVDQDLSPCLRLTRESWWKFDSKSAYENLPSFWVGAIQSSCSRGVSTFQFAYVNPLTLAHYLVWNLRPLIGLKSEIFNIRKFYLQTSLYYFKKLYFSSLTSRKAEVPLSLLIYLASRAKYVGRFFWSKFILCMKKQNVLPWVGFRLKIDFILVKLCNDELWSQNFLWMGSVKVCQVTRYFLGVSHQDLDVEQLFLWADVMVLTLPQKRVVLHWHHVVTHLPRLVLSGNETGRNILIFNGWRPPVGILKLYKLRWGPKAKSKHRKYLNKLLMIWLNRYLMRGRDPRGWVVSTLETIEYFHPLLEQKTKLNFRTWLTSRPFYVQKTPRCMSSTTVPPFCKIILSQLGHQGKQHKPTWFPLAILNSPRYAWDPLGFWYPVTTWTSIVWKFYQMLRRLMVLNLSKDLYHTSITTNLQVIYTRLQRKLQVQMISLKPVAPRKLKFLGSWHIGLLLKRQYHKNPVFHRSFGRKTGLGNAAWKPAKKSKKYLKVISVPLAFRMPTTLVQYKMKRRFKRRYFYKARLKARENVRKFRINTPSLNFRTIQLLDQHFWEYIMLNMNQIGPKLETWAVKLRGTLARTQWSRIIRRFIQWKFYMEYKFKTNIFIKISHLKTKMSFLHPVAINHEVGFTLRNRMSYRRVGRELQIQVNEQRRAYNAAAGVGLAIMSDILIKISGRLSKKADRSKLTKLAVGFKGNIPKNTLTDQIGYASLPWKTKQGILGVKVSTYTIS